MSKDRKLKMILPKGRIQEKVLKILSRAGIKINIEGRSYRPGCSDAEIEIKLLKPQNIPKLIDLGRHDCGFTGYDWVVEQKAEVVELIDTGFDPVRLIAAVPKKLAENEAFRRKSLVVASEYRNLALSFIEKAELDAVFLQTYGATEAMPPEDADMIVDNTSTGATLRRNRLEIIETLMESTTRFIANKEATNDPWKREKMTRITTLISSCLEADKRVLLEMNVSQLNFQKVIDILPCMRSPTVSPLHRESGYAVKAAVPSPQVPALIPKLIEAGARDILEFKLEKIVS